MPTFDASPEEIAEFERKFGLGNRVRIDPPHPPKPPVSAAFSGGPRSLEVTFPYPPSVNGYWRAFMGRQIISKRGRIYRKNCIALFAGKKVEKFTTPVSVDATLFQPDKRRRDLDNYLKGLLDATVTVGLIADDSLIHELHLRWGGLRKGGFVKLIITELP